MSDPLRAVQLLLEDAISELDSITMRLKAVAELLVTARNRQDGLDARSNEQRHREDWGDGHGPV